MVKIERLIIRNYRSLKSIDLQDISDFSVFLGANGVGKSTLFDVFGFLRDALRENVHVALAKRGGFREVVSRGEDGPISIEIKFREGTGPLATYRVDVGLIEGRGAVRREILRTVKARLRAMCEEAGRPDCLIRIACRELEAGFIGDLVSVEATFGIKNLSRHQLSRKYPDPDLLGAPSKEIQNLVPRYGKVQGARRMGKVLDVGRCRSPSFQAFVSGLRRYLAEGGTDGSPTDEPPPPTT